MTKYVPAPVEAVYYTGQNLVEIKNTFPEAEINISYSLFTGQVLTISNPSPVIPTEVYPQRWVVSNGNIFWTLDEFEFESRYVIY